ncbi:MAG TPA: TorF family putative porin [Novosphingobium sp.]|nr:TorF family putative porin [Novosphingobium sp.]
MREKTMRKLLGFAALAALALPTAAWADEGDGVDVSASLTGSTNYEWRGVSQSDNHAAVFASVSASYKGFYAGAGTENVDFAGINQEYDLWAGYTLPVGPVKLDVGVVRYGYVDAPANIDTTEIKGAITVPLGKASLTGSVYHTWDYFGTDADATYYEAALSMPVNDKLSVSGAFGHQTVNSLFNYNTWNLGASYTVFKGASIDVRYHDTDDSGALFGNLGKARLVGSFTLSF